MINILNKRIQKVKKFEFLNFNHFDHFFSNPISPKGVEDIGEDLEVLELDTVDI